MFSSRSFLIVAPLCLLLSFLPAAAPPAGPLPSEIARWSEELGDDSFAVREAATKKLRAVGEPAEALLEKAASGRDAEVVRRAKNILADFHWGIYASTPEKVVSLIRDYQAAPRGEKRPVIQKLISSGPAGSRALVKIARMEEDALVRRDVFTDIAAGLVQGSGMMLEQGNLAGLERLIQLTVDGAVKVGARNFAAYHLLTGHLPRRIAEVEARAKKNSPGKIEAELLAYLYRAKGDLASAAKAAADAEMSELQEGILFQNADWKTLAAHPEITDTRIWVRYVGLRAAYARLAGNTRGYELAIKDILDRARPLAERKEDVLPYAKALFLNARPAEAIELLQKESNHPRLLFEVLAVQMEFKDAFAVVDSAVAVPSVDAPVLEILKARALHDLGEKERALAILKRYSQRVKEGTVAKDWCAALVDAQRHIGRISEAIALATKIIEGSMDPSTAPTLIEKLFPDNDEEAEQLWDCLIHRNPKPAFAKILPRIHLLLSGKAGAAEVTALVVDIARAAQDRSPTNRRRDWLAAGEAARLCKQTSLAEDCFHKAGGIRGGIRCGDVLAAKKQWAQAAACYREAYLLGIKGPDAAETGKSAEDFDSLPSLAMFLHGDALVKAGREREGRQLIESAHFLPLGSGEARYHLARALGQRGHTAAARREYDLLRRVGEPILMDPDAYYTGEALRYGAIESGSHKEYLKAADGFEQAFLRCLHPEVNFHRGVAYVTVPAHIHLMRALALAQSGKLDEAKTQASRALAALPGSVEVALRLVPMFDERKRIKDADELFESTLAAYEAVIRDYPRHAGSHNQAAWLSACCRRKLEQGLSHARKAVALSPETAAYHDSLAEVLFQLGKKDEAIAAQKKALTLDPKRAYFRKQLKRIEAGDPRAPRPEEDDE